jgi:hypothetical protein
MHPATDHQREFWASPFSKMAGSVLRRIRVASKAELKLRIMAYLGDLNREPVVHTRSYRITLPA